MNRLEQIKTQIAGPYGVQAITSHDINWLIQELEKKQTITLTHEQLNAAHRAALSVGENLSTRAVFAIANSLMNGKTDEAP